MKAKQAIFGNMSNNTIKLVIILFGVIIAACGYYFGYSKLVEKALADFERLGYGKLPVCMAKTQYSFSDDQNKLGRPDGFKITIKNCRISAGAGFIVVLTGDIMTMPGLPPIPAAEKIDVSDDGVISGLF